MSFFFFLFPYSFLLLLLSLAFLNFVIIFAKLLLPPLIILICFFLSLYSVSSHHFATLSYSLFILSLSYFIRLYNSTLTAPFVHSFYFPFFFLSLYFPLRSTFYTLRTFLVSFIFSTLLNQPPSNTIFVISPMKVFPSCSVFHLHPTAIFAQYSRVTNVFSG